MRVVFVAAVLFGDGYLMVLAVSWIKVLLGFLCFLALAGVAAANFLVLRIVSNTNRRKGPEDQASMFIWYPGKLERIIDDYKSAFPDGSHVFWAKVSMSVGFGAGLTWFFLAIWYGTFR